MSTIDPLLPVPEALTRVEAYDAALARELAQVFGRLAGAGRALVWAQERLPALVATSGSTGVLQLLVDESRRLTGVEEVWALTWRGSLQRGSASFRALAGGSGVDGASPPGPADISSTVVGRVVKDGQAAWSDDAQADARFLAAEIGRAHV